MNVGLKWRKCLVTAISNLAVFSISRSVCTHFWIIPAPVHPGGGGDVYKWENWTLDRAQTREHYAAAPLVPGWEMMS